MKVALVTGAAGDIGRDICELFLAKGLKVVGLDRDGEGLQKVSAHLERREHFLPLQADVTQMSSITAAVQRATQEAGDIDVLVNNAGGITQASLLTTEERDWLHDIDLNLNGPWRCIKALQATFTRRRSGVIINIASVNGLGIYGHPGYSSAKAGLIHLTKFCAVELGKFGVRSIAVCPGSVKTSIWRERQQLNPDVFKEVASWYPSRDICTPRDVANMVVTAADDSMKLMNGAVIALDGGLTSGSDRFASLFTGHPI